MADQTNKQVRTGNQIVIMINSIQVGLIQSLRVSEDYAPEPARGVGSIDVVEYVPTIARIHLQVSRMVLRDDQLRNVNVIYTDSTTALKGIVFDILIVDKDNASNILRKYSGCSYATGDIEIRTNAIVVSNATFMALTSSGQGM